MLNLLNVIELDSIDNEHTRKLLAHKILSARTDISYVNLLELLKIGGFHYFTSENEHDFYSAAAELKKLGVSYRIIQKELPKKVEYPKEEIKKEETFESDVPKYSTQSINVSETHPVTTFLDIERDFEEIQTQKIQLADKKKHLFAAVSVIAVLIILTIILYFFMQSKNSYTLKESSDLSQPTSVQQANKAAMESVNKANKTKQSAKTKPAKAKRASTVNNSGKKNSAGNSAASPLSSENKNQDRNSQTQEEKQSDEALDSANSACIEGAIDTEKFYRAAISFNKNNMKAWQGLLNCFEKKGDHKKIAEIRSEMREVFGENVFSTAKTVADYGTVKNISAEDKIYRLSYFRDSNTDFETMQKELFSICRDIVSDSRGFDRIIVTAEDRSGSKYTASFSLADFPKTFEEFRQKIIVDKSGN